MFGAPYSDDGGTFALSCMQCATANIVVNPAGVGVMGDGGTVQNITVVAPNDEAGENHESSDDTDAGDGDPMDHRGPCGYDAG